MRRAIKLAPRATKTRTMEVVCPMCETPGFLAPADAGKDVHCCNPECMVPVFKTQRPQVEEAPPEVTGQNKPLLIGGSIVALLAAGAAVWFFVFQKPPQVDVVEEQPLPVAPTTDTLHGLTPEQNRVVQQVEAPPATVAEIRKKTLENIAERARQRERNRNAAYGAQLAAEAYAEAGDLGKAQDSLKRLQSTARDAPYFQIQPLVEIGWRQLAGGALDEARQTAQTAVSKAKGLPTSVRNTLDAVTALAALLVATDRLDDAKNLIQQDQDTGARGSLSVLWRAAVDAKTFDLEAEAGRPWHIAMPEPMRIAVVESLVARGQADQALAFAATGRDVASVDACRAAWAGRLAQLQPGQALASVAAGLQSGKASPAGQCRAWAAVVAMAISRNDPMLAQSALEKAVAALSEVQSRTSVPVPNKKALHDSEGKPHVGLANPAPSHSAALAAADVALVQLRSGEKDAAWANFQKALDYCRGMTPSPAATQALVDECQQQEPAVRQELNRLLSLGNDDERVRPAFFRYRRQCGKLDELADERLAIQVQILRAAAQGGLLEEVWTLAQQRSQEPDIQQREPYLDTSLPGLLLSLAREAGQSGLVTKITQARSDKPIVPDPIDDLAAKVSHLISAGKLREASDALEKGYRSDLAKKEPFRLDEQALRATSRIQSSQPPEQVIAFIQNLFDPVIQEDAFFLLAGDAMRRGAAAELWKLTFDSRDLEALEHVAIYRGYIAGLPAE